MRGNSDPHDLILHHGQVTSLAAPFWIRPGFAIPLVQSRFDSNVTYVQRVNLRRRIVGFDLFRTQSRIISLKQPMATSVGDPELFALIDPRGDPHVGSQNELAPTVSKWVNQIEPPLIRMSFARFCENEPLAVRSAAEALDEKASELKSKDRATLWFVGAVILAELLEALGSAAGTASDHLREAIYSDISTPIQLDQRKLRVELPQVLLTAEAKIGQNGKLERLIGFVHAVLGRDFELRARIDRQSFDYPNSPNQTEAIIAAIKQYSRQEQRLAQLIKHTLENPSIGRHLIEEYSDHTTFMERALSTLRARLTRWSNQDALELELAALLPFLISSAYPRQLGRLLVELALALKHFPAPAKAIRDRAMRSRSQIVKPLQSEIVQLLL